MFNWMMKVFLPSLAFVIVIVAVVAGAMVAVDSSWNGQFIWATWIVILMAFIILVAIGSLVFHITGGKEGINAFSLLWEELTGN